MLHAAPARRPAEERCWGCPSLKNGFCSHLARDSLAAFAARSHRISCEQGTEIAGQGENVDRIGVIASGFVKIVMITESGEEHLLQILQPGQFVGDPKKGHTAYSWEAATQASACWISRQAWNDFLGEDQRHFQAYLATIGNQINDARHAVVRMRGRNTLQRVACWLLEQSPDQRAEKAMRIRIVLTRRDLASLLDMTVETLCRALHQLDDRKAIRLVEPDLVEVVDFTRLRTLAKWNDDTLQRAFGRSALNTPQPSGARWEETAASLAARDGALSRAEREARLQ